MTTIYPIILYIILAIIYFYSTGRFKSNKKEAYKTWVENTGKKVARAVLIITVIYTILLVVQYFG